jgi:hypothetical protein
MPGTSLNLGWSNLAFADPPPPHLPFQLSPTLLLSPTIFSKSELQTSQSMTTTN